MTSTLRRTSSAASAGRRSSFSLRISPLNDNVFSLHVPKLAQTLPECLDAGRDSWKGAVTCKISYPGDFRWLLRLGETEQSAKSMAHKCKDGKCFSSCSLSRLRSSCHSSLDTRPFSFDHLVRSRQHIRRNRQADLLGRFQIDDQLKLVGCSTGRSAGLAPFRILSTYVAARRYKSAKFAP